MMDRLMLLAKGKVIYFNEARLAVDYFATINFKCPELSNPSDYFMSIMSIETIEQEEMDDGPDQGVDRSQTLQDIYQKRIDMFSRAYENSQLKNDPDVVDGSVVPLSSTDQAHLSSDAGWFYQFSLLAQRNFLNIMRLPQTSYVKFIVTCLTAIFCIILFYDV